MWRSKKFILIAALIALVVAGSLGGVALAQTGSSDNTTSGKTLLARVAAILGIDQQKVESAFAQARQEMQDEALDSYLKNLVDQGKITQEQADQYKQWWQSRPDISQYEQHLREWQQARPDVTLDGPFAGFGGRGFRGGMGMGRGGCFGGW